jgi:hypothetical protein
MRAHHGTLLRTLLLLLLLRWLGLLGLAAGSATCPIAEGTVQQQQSLDRSLAIREGDGVGMHLRV